MDNHPSSSFSPLRRAIRLPGLALLATLASINLFAGATETMESTIPKVGDQAPAFTLQTLDDKPVDPGRIGKGKKVILVVLRGWPGYQCPFCTTQVYEYVGHAADFAAGNFQIVMVYPGPAEQLRQHAADFLQDKRWPQGFFFLIDPDYTFTNRYGLRWNEKKETAYPSTFVIDETGKITFVHVSHEHGDRVGAAALLRMLKANK